MEREYIEVSYDKFTLKIEKSSRYGSEENWVRQEDGILLIGVTDFAQTNAGDIAIVSLPETGQEINQGDEAGVIETIKTTISFISPISGTVEEVNSKLEDEPQLINEDPFGEGWIMKIRPSNWEEEGPKLMNFETYKTAMEEKLKSKLEKK